MTAVAEGRRSRADLFSDAYAEHFRIVRCYIGQRVDPHTAEELAQDTFLKAWRNIDIARDDENGLRPWLIVIARNVVNDYFRRTLVRPAESPFELSTEDVASEEASPEDHAIAASLWREVSDALSPEHLAVLRLAYFDDLDGVDVARELGIPHGTVKSRRFTARATLTARGVA